jgi:hypothetical protein
MGIALRHVACTLFVSNEDVSNAGFQQRVIRREDAAARKTKHGLHVFHFKRTDERFSSSEYLFG